MDAKVMPAPQRSFAPGVILISIGLIFFAAQWFPENGAFVLGAIAFVFIALAATTRQVGFFIPGAILGGLAVGVGLEDAGYGLNGSAVVLGLAGGFFAIFIANALTRSPAYWWPLIPGGILAAVGMSQLVGGTEAERIVALAWPLVLIAVGVIVLIDRSRVPQPRT